MIKIMTFGAGVSAIALVLSAPLQAQTAASMTVTPPPAGATSGAAQLSENLKIIARDPFNVDAILKAGSGALAIGDTNAAFGFFARAEELSPRNWKAKAGLGSSLTLMEKPAEGLRAFEEAVALGAPDSEIYPDRGLAYDQLGDGKRAQRDYLAALNQRPSDEVTRRLALSLAIHGDRDAGLARLKPLLARNDQGAWRARAFILAMTGDMAGAGRIVQEVVPPNMVPYMTSFLQKLAGLGPAAKARAVNFGTIPASAGGNQLAAVPTGFKPVDPNKGAQLIAQDAPQRLASAAPGFVADTNNRDSNRKSRSERTLEASQTRRQPVVAAAPPPPPPPAQSVVLPPPVATAAVSTPVIVSAPPPPPPVRTAETTVPPAALFEVPAVASRPVVAAAPPPVSPAPNSASSFSAASTSGTGSFSTQRSAPIVTTRQTASDSTRVGLADIVRTLDLERESAPVALPDEAKIKAARIAAQKKAAAEEKARAEKAEKDRLAAEERAKARRNPARVWVQIATGSNKSGLSSTWRSIKSKAQSTLSSRKPWYVAFGSTYRVLVGPYRSSAEASAAVKALGKDGVRALTFTSAAGQEVMSIDN